MILSVSEREMHVVFNSTQISHTECYCRSMHTHLRWKVVDGVLCYGRTRSCDTLASEGGWEEGGRGERRERGRGREG